MTTSKEVQKIQSEVREYLAFMASQNKTPSCVYLRQAQIDKLQKQAKRDGIQWHPVIDGYPIKVWEA